MILSIIIPTKNEEIFLPKILKSIKKQNFCDYEIIVADAGSTDKTRDIAASFGARIVEGGMPGAGRNRGAAAAKGETFLFLDADVILPKEYFLKKALAEFKEKRLDAACALSDPITSDRKIKVFFDLVYNIPIAKLERISPHGAWAVFVKKDIYEKIKGYDEKMKLCEDHDFVQRAARVGKFKVLRSAKIFISLRRFYQDGWLKTIAVYVIAEFYNDFIGPIESDIFKYKFGHYSKKIKD